MRLEPDSPLSSVGSRSLLTPLRVGAIVHAVAVRDEADQLWLQIAGQRLAARLATPHTAPPPHGALLQLQVLRTSPVLAVKVLADPGNEARKLLLNEALRRYLPRQDSPAPLLANLNWLMSRPPTAEQRIPDAVLQAVQRLWQAVPTTADLGDPQRLRETIQRSGLFLENTLAQPAGAQRTPEHDLKALLLNLLQALKAHGARPESASPDHAMHAPLPDVRAALQVLRRAPATLAALDDGDQQLDELARQCEGTLARLTSHQLASAEGGHTLMMELPLRQEHHSTTLRLRIEREPRSKDESEDGWSVETAMDLGIDGALHARVHLRGKRVGVQLRAESPALQARLAAHLDELELLLQRAGLQPHGVVCLHGLPQTDTGESPRRLLDVQA